MKAYVFKLNGRTIPLEDVKNCLVVESDWWLLFEQGSIECENCSGETQSMKLQLKKLRY